MGPNGKAEKNILLYEEVSEPDYSDLDVEKKTKINFYSVRLSKIINEGKYKNIEDFKREVKIHLKESKLIRDIRGLQISNL